MKTLFIDTETFSEVPITNGVFAYSEKVEVMIVTYAIDDGPVQAWDITSGFSRPLDLKNALSDPTVEIVVHNSQFDRTVTRQDFMMRLDLPLNRIHDTMARARAHSLPGGLGKLCGIFAIPADQAKDKAGRNLIMLFCKPRPKNSELRRATRLTHPKEWAQFLDYAKSDISAMRVLYKKLPMWNFQGFEREFWEVDARINERGVATDLELVDATLFAISETTDELSRRTAEQTGNSVQMTTQRDRLLKYIELTYGIKYPDLTATMVDKALNAEDTPREVKDLLLLRAEASKSSTAKYKKFKEATSSDGRLRGLFVYCGASRTGRFAGNIVQPQNLPRPTMPAEDIELGIDALKAGCAGLIFPSVMSLASNAIRGCFIPAPGKKFVIADLSNIEGRVCAWLAGEEWKLQAFRDFDAGTGPDLYKLAYAKAFRIDHTKVDKHQRSVGKVLELFMQYGGGVGAFVTGARGYGIDLDDLADRAWDSIPLSIREESRKWWEVSVKEKKTYDLAEKTFVVCDSLKRMWRAAHPGTTGWWANIKWNLEAAVSSTGVYMHRSGMLQYHKNGAWTRIVLPSGRSLCYPSMRLVDGELSYAGINPYSRQWGRVKTYSGKICENICQAVARDVLAAGIMNAEKAGYPVVMHIHDEIVSEVPDKEGYTVDRLSELMTSGINWADGLPLAAAGFEATRYKKE